MSILIGHLPRRKPRSPRSGARTLQRPPTKVVSGRAQGEGREAWERGNPEICIPCIRRRNPYLTATMPTVTRRIAEATFASCADASPGITHSSRCYRLTVRPAIQNLQPDRPPQMLQLLMKAHARTGRNALGPERRVASPGGTVGPAPRKQRRGGRTRAR